MTQPRYRRRSDAASSTRFTRQTAESFDALGASAQAKLNSSVRFELLRQTRDAGSGRWCSPIPIAPASATSPLVCRQAFSPRRASRCNTTPVSPRARGFYKVARRMRASPHASPCCRKLVHGVDRMAPMAADRFTNTVACRSRRSFSSSRHLAHSRPMPCCLQNHGIDAWVRLCAQLVGQLWSTSCGRKRSSFVSRAASSRSATTNGSTI
jgi:hypothetical protein